MSLSEAAASKEAGRTRRYVEPLSDAGTALTLFLSILLDAAWHPTGWRIKSWKQSEKMGSRCYELESVLCCSLLAELILASIGNVTMAEYI